MIEEKGDNVWRVRASKPGASFLLLGGMHGNEATGIEVVRHFVSGFQEGRYTLAAGTFTCALINTRAMAINERWVDGKDMNRQFTPAHLEHSIDGSWEEERAREIAALCQEVDFLLDIHSTNKPSNPFGCGRIDDAHLELFKWFQLENLLGDPHYVLAGEPATVDEYMNLLGKEGICVETGLAGDITRTKNIIQSVEAIMSERGLLDLPLPLLPPAPHGRFVMDSAIVYDERGWAFAPGVGDYSFQPVKKGDVLGYRGTEAVRADKDAVILFPKLPIHWQLGKAIFYLAVPSA